MLRWMLTCALITSFQAGAGQRSTTAVRPGSLEPGDSEASIGDSHAHSRRRGSVPSTRMSALLLPTRLRR